MDGGAVLMVPIAYAMSGALIAANTRASWAAIAGSDPNRAISVSTARAVRISD